jgi:hypothetical protein
MLYYGRLLHDGMGRGWFKYRIDGGYSRGAMKKLAAEVELLVSHTQGLEPEYFEEYRKMGVDTWFYGPMMYPERKAGCGTNTFVDQDLLMARSIPWTAWKYRAGWVQWEFDFNAYSAWYDPETVKQANRACNGSGQMIYRGVVQGFREPIPSIRLKALRRGLQDYEYFWLLQKKTGAAAESDRLVNGVVHKDPFGKKSMLDIEIWKNNPGDWDRARTEAGRLIAGE